MLDSPVNKADVRQETKKASQASPHFQEDNYAEIDDDNEDDDDDEEEDTFRDPPKGFIRIRPSAFAKIPDTIFLEYPPELNRVRNDFSVLEPERKRKLCYVGYDRICIRNAFRRAGFEKNEKNWTVMWSKHQPNGYLNSLNCLQKVNHFPGSWCIGRKDRLQRTISGMKRVHGATEYGFHPQAFVLPPERDLLFRHVNKELEAAKAKLASGSMKKSEFDKSCLYIYKPCASSCGKGIKVMTGQQVLGMRKGKSGLIQKYLVDPYLIDGKKFDLRIYVMVSGVDPLRVYIHKEGLTRISTSEYSLKNLNNKFAHLTNFSINKKSEKFHAAAIDDNDPNSETEGFKWSLTAFKRWLGAKESPAVANETFDKIHDLCLKTMIAAESEITPRLYGTANYRTNCFELFGCDVILDSTLTPHLLEVNVSPALAGSSPLDKQIKGTLIADILHVVGIYPHDTRLLKMFGDGADGVTTSASSNGTGCSSSSAPPNPFEFGSLSKMMACQDAWRRSPSPMNIDLKSLGNTDSAWMLLLMIEDEFSRGESTQFYRAHPRAESAVHYNSLYKSYRFSDHMLAKWVIDGRAMGCNLRAIPSKFIKVVSKLDNQSGDGSPGNNSANNSSSGVGGTGRALTQAIQMTNLHTGRPSSGPRTRKGSMHANSPNNSSSISSSSGDREDNESHSVLPGRRQQQQQQQQHQQISSMQQLKSRSDNHSQHQQHLHQSHRSTPLQQVLSPNRNLTYDMFDIHQGSSPSDNSANETPQSLQLQQSIQALQHHQGQGTPLSPRRRILLRGRTNFLEESGEGLSYLVHSPSSSSADRSTREPGKSPNLGNISYHQHDNSVGIGAHNSSNNNVNSFLNSISNSKEHSGELRRTFSGSTLPSQVLCDSGRKTAMPDSNIPVRIGTTYPSSSSSSNVSYSKESLPVPVRIGRPYKMHTEAVSGKEGNDGFDSNCGSTGSYMKGGNNNHWQVPVDLSMPMPPDLQSSIMSTGTMDTGRNSPAEGGRDGSPFSNRDSDHNAIFSSYGQMHTLLRKQMEYKNRLLAQIALEERKKETFSNNFRAMVKGSSFVDDGPTRPHQTQSPQALSPQALSHQALSHQAQSPLQNSTTFHNSGR